MTVKQKFILASRGAAMLASIGIALLPASQALASQGPGTTSGGAGAMTQLTMAIVVYGVSGAIVLAGLIGAVRQR